MRTIALLAALALAVPAAALADKPTSPGKPDTAPNKGKSAEHAPKVMYVLRGTLTAYAAPTASTDGTVSVLVKGANHHGTTLKGMTLKFAVTSTTKVVADGGAVTPGDRGLVKVRGPKKATAGSDLATMLQAIAARQVVDQGQPTP
jgi:hypothetical protein